MVKGFDDDVEWSEPDRRRPRTKRENIKTRNSIRDKCTINYFTFPVGFPLPFVCWFVRSPASVSKDRTRSASSSESGSDDVGFCSAEQRRENGLRTGKLWLKYQWHRQRGWQGEWLDYRTHSSHISLRMTFVRHEFHPLPRKSQRELRCGIVFWCFLRRMMELECHACTDECEDKGLTFSTCLAIIQLLILALTVVNSFPLSIYVRPMYR